MDEPVIQIKDSEQTYGLGLCLADGTILGDVVTEPELTAGKAGARVRSREVVRLLAAGEWTAATNHLTAGLQRPGATDFAESRLYALRGYAAQKLGRPDQAMEDFQTALAMDVATVEAWSGMACMMAEQNRFNDALVYFLEACEHLPDNPSLRYNLGNVYLTLRDPKSAEAELARAVALNPEFYRAWVNLGVSQASRGDHAEAITSLTQAAAIHPRSRRVQTNLGLTLARLKRWPEAAAAIRRAIDLEPDRGRSYLVLSMIERCQGNHAAALQALNDCIDRDLELDRSYHHLGLIHERLKNRTQAMAAFEAAIDANPRYARAHASLGQAYRSEGNPQEAERCLRRAAELRPDLTEAWIGRAELAIDRGDQSEAGELLEEALRQRPEDPRANTLMGRLHARAGRTAEAMVCYRRLVEQGDDDAGKLLSLIFPGKSTPSS